jgi:hypothetical protein
VDTGLDLVGLQGAQKGSKLAHLGQPAGGAAHTLRRFDEVG